MNDAVKPAVSDLVKQAFFSKVTVTKEGSILNFAEGFAAALAAQGQEPVAIKALEWEERDDASHCATSAIGQYHVFPGTGFSYDLCGPVGGRLATLKRLSEAKAAAQSDYETRIRSAITAPAQPVDPDEETYQIGIRDGYSQAVQQIDQLTGGDGEYRYCTDHDPERHTPDPASMIQRIVDRFETLNLLNEATATGSDEPDDGPFAPAQPVGVQAGWKLVPVEPTYEMAIALGCDWDGGKHYRPFPERYASFLSATPQPPAEGGWVRVPEKPTPAMAYAAACAHYGKKLVDATGIEGISMTVNGIDCSFPRAFRKFWKGALSALPPAPANGGEQNG